MKAIAWMAAGSLATAALAVALAGGETRVEVLLGMVAPLAATTLSWVLTERTYKRDPEQLTGLMLKAFGAKILFFGAYVALMLTVVRLHPAPFVVSFTGFFVALYVTEAVLMRRLFAGE